MVRKEPVKGLGSKNTWMDFKLRNTGTHVSDRFESGQTGSRDTLQTFYFSVSFRMAKNRYI